MKKAILVFSAMLAAAAFASPDVTSITVTQDPATRNLTIDYTLDYDPAVITVEIYTNDVRVVCEQGTLVGDVNRLVQTGNRRIYWHPDNCGFTGPFTVWARVIAWPVDKPPTYMVVDLRPPLQRFYYDRIEEIPFGHTNDMYKTEWMIFRKIPAKGVKWRMGGGTETGTYENEYWGHPWNVQRAEVHHWVNISEDFYLAIYELTQQQASCIQGNMAAQPNPTVSSLYTYNNLRGSMAAGIDWPTTGSQVATDSVLDKARKYTGISTLDLPTEAEWEYACRAGTGTAFYDGSNVSTIHARMSTDLAFCSDATHTYYSRTIVGQKLPNRWYLYDMYGNCGEWCLDWYNETQYEENGEYTDPQGPASTDDCEPTRRVWRGGTLGSQWAAYFRSGKRDSGDPSSASTSTGYYNLGSRLKCAATAMDIVEE